MMNRAYGGKVVFEESVMTRRSNRAVVMVMKHGDIEIAFYKDGSMIVDAIQMGNICSLLDVSLNE